LEFAGEAAVKGGAPLQQVWKETLQDLVQ